MCMYIHKVPSSVCCESLKAMAPLVVASILSSHSLNSKYIFPLKSELLGEMADVKARVEKKQDKLRTSVVLNIKNN